MLPGCCSLNELKQELRIPSTETILDDLLNAEIDAVSDDCQTVAGRIFVAQTYSNEEHFGGGDTIVVDNWPISPDQTLQVKGFDSTGLAIFDPSAYAVDYDKGIIRLLGELFPTGPAGAQVSYFGGFSIVGTDADAKISIPIGPSRQCRVLAAARFRKSRGLISADDLEKAETAANSAWKSALRGAY